MHTYTHTYCERLTAGAGRIISWCQRRQIPLKYDQRHFQRYDTHSILQLFLKAGKGTSWTILRQISAKNVGHWRPSWGGLSWKDPAPALLEPVKIAWWTKDIQSFPPVKYVRFLKKTLEVVLRADAHTRNCWNKRGSGQDCWSILACENRFREKRGYYCLRGKLSINLIDAQLPLGPSNRRFGDNKPPNQLLSIKVCKPYILRQNSSCFWNSREKYCRVPHPLNLQCCWKCDEVNFSYLDNIKRSVGKATVSN